MDLKLLALSSVSLMEVLGSKPGVSSMALDMDRVTGAWDMIEPVLSLSLEPLGRDCHYAQIKLKSPGSSTALGHTQHQ